MSKNTVLVVMELLFVVSNLSC